MIFVVVRLCHLQEIDWHCGTEVAPVITADLFDFSMAQSLVREAL